MQTISLTPADFLSTLPAQAHDKMTDKYMFLDTRKVIDDMKDLGFEAIGARRPRTRTPNGAFGLHEVEFMKPEWRNLNGKEAPRVLFMNSYDGSRKAQFAAGLIRFACLNGMIVGDMMQQDKFIHLGNYEEELLKQMRDMASSIGGVFDRLELFREIQLDPAEYLDMAEAALRLRFPDVEDRPVFPADMLLMPRRLEDLGDDLWSKFNVVQENVIRGGLPARSVKTGDIRLTQPVQNIERSNRLNGALWDLLDQTAELA